MACSMLDLRERGESAIKTPGTIVREAFGLTKPDFAELVVSMLSFDLRRDWIAKVESQVGLMISELCLSSSSMYFVTRD